MWYKLIKGKFPENGTLSVTRLEDCSKVLEEKNSMGGVNWGQVIPKNWKKKAKCRQDIGEERSNRWNEKTSIFLMLR